jgi:hypothetical protein
VGHTIVRRMPPTVRMGKHRDGRDGCAGMVSIGRPTKGPSDWTRPLLLFWSFPRQPRFISVPSLSNPCWWVGGRLLHLLDSLEGCPGAGFFANINQVSIMALVLEGFGSCQSSVVCIDGYRCLPPRHRVCLPACTCPCPDAGRQWEVKEVGDHKDVMSSGAGTNLEMGTSTAGHLPVGWRDNSDL